VSPDRPAPPALDPRRYALFADLDGTLAPIRPRPQDVGPDPERAAVLAGLGAAMDGALAVISGRALGDLDRILDGGVTAVAAVHGLVRRRADGAMAAAAAPLPMVARLAVQAFADTHPPLRAEDKGVAIALHYRADPAAARACLDFAREIAERCDLAVQPGDHVVELRAPGPTKGDAVTAFMAEPPFRGRRPVFLGDDLTDEDGFAAAERAGGFGVVVGPRRPTLARYALPDVPAVLAWLSEAPSHGAARV
jgi:trehalose 6-phosphate phosphatase